MTAHETQDWGDLFVAAAGAGAVLTGLIFVAVSVNIRPILDADKETGGRVFGWPGRRGSRCPAQRARDQPRSPHTHHQSIVGQLRSRRRRPLGRLSHYLDEEDVLGQLRSEEQLQQQGVEFDRMILSRAARFF
jgi:hypothetical protein